MGSLSKCQTISEEFGTNNGEDRISKLPDCLIAKILSSLPTKNAVATRVLSTKWNRSWTYITHLDFNDEIFRPCTEPSITFSVRISFIRSVNRDTLLERFRLKCSQRHNPYQIFGLVFAVLFLPLKEIDLSVLGDAYSFFPEELFSCKTLEVAKLGTNFELKVPSLVNLPSLKVLHLCGVKLLDNDSIATLISGCPLLEELNMKNCKAKKVFNMNICSLKLKILTLTNAILKHTRFRVSANFKFQVLIQTPSLLELEITACAPAYVVLKDAKHLKTAKLDLNPDGRRKEHKKEALLDLFKGVSQVQNLFLSQSFYLSVLSEGQQHLSNLPLFQNLVHLDLNTEWLCQLLPMLLKKSPFIETLTFQQQVDYNFELTHLDLPSCLARLKVIEFMKFGEGMKELTLVKYFLENAKILEKIIIHYPLDRCCVDIPFNDTAIWIELLACKIRAKKDQLLKLPRVSENCQVIIL